MLNATRTAETVLTRDSAITTADAAGELFGALIGERDAFMVAVENVRFEGAQLQMNLRGSWFNLDIITIPADEMVIDALRDQVLFSAISEHAEDKLTEYVSVFSQPDSDTIFFFAPDSSTKLVLRAL